MMLAEAAAEKEEGMRNSKRISRSSRRSFGLELTTRIKSFVFLLVGGRGVVLNIFQYV